MAISDINGKQLSPCIVSKARYALGLKNIQPTNDKHCSKEYLDKTVRAIPGARNDAIKNALNQYYKLFSV